MYPHHRFGTHPEAEDRSRFQVYEKGSQLTLSDSSFLSVPDDISFVDERSHCGWRMPDTAAFLILDPASIFRVAS